MFYIFFPLSTGHLLQYLSMNTCLVNSFTSQFIVKTSQFPYSYETGALDNIYHIESVLFVFVCSFHCLTNMNLCCSCSSYRSKAYDLCINAGLYVCIYCLFVSLNYYFLVMIVFSFKLMPPPFFWNLDNKCNRYRRLQLNST